MSESMIVQVDGQVAWKAWRDSKSSRWIAVCDPLRLTAEGGTWGELQSTIGEIMNALLIDLLKDGELHQFLVERKWVANRPIPKRLPARGIYFDVPSQVRQSRPVHAST